VAAIAALAYGTETIQPVLKIAGPGSIYVQAAKLSVFGEVDIDMPAGPSEGIIIADEGADPVYCAAGILARCEHAPDAGMVMVTWDEDLAQRTIQEIQNQLPKLSRSQIIQESLLKYSAIILVDSPQEAIDYTNDYAPEHLEVLVAKPEEYLPKLRNAGSIFLGYNCTVPLGDYASGTNHVLPTGGWAKMFSPVGVETFLKKSEIQSVTAEGLQTLAPIVETIAGVEKLDAHWNSVRVRLEQTK
jgi:histidinol dehydrogenase